MRPQILANAVMNAMKKSRTFDDIFEEVLRLNEDADSGAPALVRSNDELIELWWDRYADTLYHSLVITYGSGARQFAEDAVSEAFFRLHKALRRGECIENPRAWVWTVARRLMLTEIKRAGSADTKHRAFASLVSTPTPTPDDVLCDQCKRAAYERALATLSDLERQCLELRARDLKLAEIGKIMKLDHRRVAEIIARASRRLAETVDE
jgi:RNA polymerase sigma factor (sigma-70 family)